MRPLRVLRRFGALLLLAGLASCATTATPKKYGWGGQPASGGGSGLTPIADQTTIANVSGGSAIPTATSAAAMRTMLGVQASSSVAITGGTIAGVTITGYQPSVTQIQWQIAAAQAAVAAIPSLTRCEYIKLGQIPLGAAATPNAFDSHVEGGGILNGTFVATSIFQAPKTGKWFMRWRAKMSTPASGHTVQLGFQNSAATHAVTFGDIFGASTTKWALRIIGAGTTDAVSTDIVDTGLHNYDFYLDGTAGTPTLKLDVDGVNEIAQTTLTNLADEPMFPTVAVTALGDGSPRALEYCFVE